MEHFKLVQPEMLSNAGPLPWRMNKKPVAEINPIGSMISEDESRYLYWMAKEYFSNRGTIVDLGPLAGGSTCSLATGLADGPYNASVPLIHSYDLWEYWEDWGRFFPGKSFRHLEDIQGAFLDNLGSLSRFVVPHKGNICEAVWNGSPIEILFIDVAKSPETMERIVNEFYPALIPASSIVIHQDFISAECPWIHAIQESLSSYFELVDSPDDSSVCFRLIRKIPKGVLGANFYVSLNATEGDQLICSAASHLKGWYKLCVLAARSHFHVLRGNVNLALKILDEIVHSPDYDEKVDYDVSLVKRAMPAKLSPSSWLRSVRSWF
jgi:hypothetical protein